MIAMLSPFLPLAYPLQRIGQDLPALSPEPVALERLPLGQSPFLHCLLGLRLDLVRQLRRYYETVRLPVTVHRRGASLDFPARSVIPSQTVTGSPGFRPRCLRACTGSQTAPGPKASCDIDAPGFAFRLVQERRHQGVATACAMVVQFRGSMAGLHVPLSTLHPRRYRRTCMTRSQCGSLTLHCMKLSFTTPCRLLPALSEL